MRQTIDQWCTEDDSLPQLAYGKILAVHILNDTTALAVFDCAGKFFDTYQLVKLNGEWRIANKFFADL